MKDSKTQNPLSYSARALPFAVPATLEAIKCTNLSLQEMETTLYKFLPYFDENQRQTNLTLNPNQMAELCKRVADASANDPDLTNEEATIIVISYLAEAWPQEKQALINHAKVALDPEDYAYFDAVMQGIQQPARQSLKSPSQSSQPTESLSAVEKIMAQFNKFAFAECPDISEQKVTDFCTASCDAVADHFVKNISAGQAIRFTENALQRCAYEGLRAMQREGRIGEASAEQIGAYFAAGALVETAHDAKGKPLDAETKQKIHESILEEASYMLDPHFEAFKTNYYATAKHAAKKQDVPTTASTFTRVVTTSLAATIGAWAMSLIFGKAEKGEDGQTVYKSTFLKRALGIGLLAVATLGVAKIAVQGRQPLEAAKDITSFVSRTARNITAPAAGRA